MLSTSTPQLLSHLLFSSYLKKLYRLFICSTFQERSWLFAWQLLCSYFRQYWLRFYYQYISFQILQNVVVSSQIQRKSKIYWKLSGVVFPFRSKFFWLHSVFSQKVLSTETAWCNGHLTHHHHHPPSWCCQQWSQRFFIWLRSFWCNLDHRRLQNKLCWGSMYFCILIEHDRLIP